MVTVLTNTVFIFWASITLVCTVPVLSHYWWKVRRDEIEASLKQMMLEQGRSADEICRVLEARTGKGRNHPRRNSIRQGAAVDI